MGLFNRKSKNVATPTTVYKMVTETGNGFFVWNGKIFDSDIVRSCIRPAARACGKLVPKHIRTTGSLIETNPDVYMRFLLSDPNPYMSQQQLQEKLRRQLDLNSNAFALIVRDDNDIPIGIYPINASSYEAVYDQWNYLYIRFVMTNGAQYTFPYSDIIHLRCDLFDNDVFGSPKFRMLEPLMNMVGTMDQSVINAIKNSSAIKWLLRYTQSMRPDDIKKNAREFAENYLAISDEALGVAATDAKAEVTQIKPTDYVPNVLQSDRTSQRIFNIFGTNENIVQSRYNENEWNAYYESEIEPFALDMSLEYTRKLFTRKQRGFGNQIIFEAANLQYASMSTKLALSQMVDRGAMTPNEWRAVFNLAPVPGGDEPIRRLDTAPVSGESDQAEGGEDS